MRSCRCLLVVAALTVQTVICASPAAAQGLPQDIVTLGGSASAAQLKTITDFIQRLIPALTGSDHIQQSQARQDLVEQINLPGASEAFKMAYSSSLSSVLLPLANHQNPEVRLNVFVITSHLIDPGVVPIILVGMKDSRPDVRYWAAKTITLVEKEPAGGAPAPPVQAPGLQQQLLQALGNACFNELSPPVLAQILLAMNSLTVPGAQTQLLKVLNERVNLHSDPRTPFRAELAGLQDVCDKNVAKPLAPADLRLLTVVLFRYMDVITQQLEAKPPKYPDANRNDMLAMLRMIGLQLPFCVSKLANVSPPAGHKNFEPAVKVGDWLALRVCVEEWRKLLSDPPLNFKADEMNLRQGPTTAPGN